MNTQEVGFKPHTIQKSPKGGRGLTYYEDVLHFRRQELEGESVLDLGASQSARFSRDLEAVGVRAKVVSLSPDYIFKQHRQMLKGHKLGAVQHGRPVAATADQLPFASDSFDRVLALFSVSVHARNDYAYWLPEILRTMRVGGNLHLGPFFLPPTHMNLEEEHRACAVRQEYIHQLGHSYRYEKGGIPHHQMLILRKDR